MADYYVDGTIASVSGQGDGSQGNPWGKTDDLWDYCLSQIAAAGGAGATGDNLIVLDGGFSQTTDPDPTVVAYAQTKQLYVQPNVLDGTQRIPFDCGTKRVMGASITERGFQFYFCDFTNLSPDGTTIYLNRDGSVYYCSFDGSGGSHAGVCRLGQGGRVIGCRFFNDNRTTGLFNSGTSGQQVMWNIFEPSANRYMVYTYGSVFAHNLILPQSGMTYNTGMVLPITYSRMFRNTFYGENQKGAGFFVTTSYESNYIANNYFEGIYSAINDYGASQHMNTFEVLCGNRSYNIANTEMPPSDHAVMMNQNNEWGMSESGLIDPANGDFRPNKNLINAGWRDDQLNTEITSNFAELGIKPTVGAYDAITVAQRVRDLF